MMPQLNPDELKHYTSRRKALPVNQTTYNRSDLTKGHLTELRKLWRRGKAFFITGVVNAPYDGCFHEPQIWLITPPGCEEHESLNALWKPQYPPERALLLKAISGRREPVERAESDMRRELQRVLREMDERAESLGYASDGPMRKLFDKFTGYTLYGLEFWLELRDELGSLCACLEELGPKAEQEELINNIVLYLDVQGTVQEVLMSLREEEKGIKQQHPELPRPPDSIVWPLYATGHGVATDVIWSFSELVDWLVDGELPPDRESRHGAEYARGSYRWGRGSFDSFEVHPWGPISEFPPREHYWGHAISVAAERYEMNLPWKCDKCGCEVEGKDDSDCAPHFTGYRGNGGIGVFMEGALCDNCFDQGCCDVCRFRGGDDYDMYDTEVADLGASLCQWHTEQLLADALFGTPEAIELLESLKNEECLDLELVTIGLPQPVLPGVELEPLVEFRLCRRVDLEGPPPEYGPNCTLQPIEGLVFDADVIEERAREMDLEGVDRTSRWPRGLTLIAEHVARAIKETGCQP